MDEDLIFVSYSSKDGPFAITLATELQQMGAKVWIDQLGIELGEDWDSSIEKALESSNTLLLIISPTAVKSTNVKDEVSIAIEENKKLVPVLILPCDLPMRWKRKQYADLVNNPDKALRDLLRSLGLEESLAEKLSALPSLIGVSGDNEQIIEAMGNLPKHSESESTNKGDLLVSEPEIDRAIVMHEKGVKRNWFLIIGLAVISLGLVGLFLFLNLDIPSWMVVVCCLSLNLLSIKPYGGLRNRQRNIELMHLFKLKRERLIRVGNKLSQTDLNNFNDEFLSYIAI